MSFCLLLKDPPEPYKSNSFSIGDMFTKIYKMGNKVGIYFPKLQQIYQRGDLLSIVLRKEAQEVTFLAKYNYNIVIRKAFAQQLHLQVDDEVEIHIVKVQSLPRTSTLFSGNTIDLLYCIPETTYQGYAISVNSFFKFK